MQAEHRRRSGTRLAATATLAVVVLAVAGGAAVARTDNPAKSTEPVTLRLGYFPNVTHAPAIVGVQGGILAKELGTDVDVKLSTFNSGTEAVQAFQARALDASYIGPNPTITAWTQFDKGVQVVSGAASGGAYLVVKPDINQRGRPQGQGRGVAAARQHPGRRAAHLAEEQGPQDRHRRRR